MASRYRRQQLFKALGLGLWNGEVSPAPGAAYFWAGLHPQFGAASLGPGF
jgi:hypothetical protein